MEGRQEQRLEGSEWVCRMAHGLTLPAERPSCRALRTISPNVVRIQDWSQGYFGPLEELPVPQPVSSCFRGRICNQARMTQWRRQWHPTPLTLAWKIPWMEEPGRLQSMGSLGVRHD